MDANFNIGKAIKTIRTRKGISAIFLANKVGIAPSTLCKYENNQRKVKSDLLPTFAAILDVNIEYFFDKRIGDTPTKDKTA